MRLSILIPTLSSRSEKFNTLIAGLEAQIKDLPVEVLWLGDNRKRTVGAKRAALLAASKGDYITHLDDDDAFAGDFVARVMSALAEDPDVVSYDSLAVINNANPFRVKSSIYFEHHNADWRDGVWYDIERKPWHWCVWRGSIARAVGCQDVAFAEDFLMCEEMLKSVNKEVRIDAVLHYYTHND